MGVDVRLVTQQPADVDAITVPVFADRIADAPEPAFLACCGFTGKCGETLLLPGIQPDGPARILVGLGTRAQVNEVTLRDTAAEVARAARRCQRVAIDLQSMLDGVRGTGWEQATAAIVEGFLLGSYEFVLYRSARGSVCRLDVVVGDADVRGAAAAAERLAHAVMLARDLGNEPGGSLTPTEFGERAHETAKSTGLRCEVWDQGRIEEERLGGLLGVSRGSTQPPRLVKLVYEPDDPEGHMAWVGKGVTFDSGGLTFKPITMMFDMKLDMAGAAAVLAAMSVLNDVNCRVRVTG
jgi:leucyl aminopeptidase